MNERGSTLVELLMVAGLIMILAAFAIPQIKAYSVVAYALGAGRKFEGEFRKARSIAVRSVQRTAIRFEKSGGVDYFSLYRDGNHNGVLTSEIDKGIDERIAGPFRLDAGLPGVRVGINPGVPNIPPERGMLSTADPIKFGRSDILSFSPDGTATSGTLYLASETVQVGVRVSGQTARVRFFVYANGTWRER